MRTSFKTSACGQAVLCTVVLFGLCACSLEPERRHICAAATYGESSAPDLASPAGLARAWGPKAMLAGTRWSSDNGNAEWFWEVPARVLVTRPFSDVPGKQPPKWQKTWKTTLLPNGQLRTVSEDGWSSQTVRHEGDGLYTIIDGPGAYQTEFQGDRLLHRSFEREGDCWRETSRTEDVRHGTSLQRQLASRLEAQEAEIRAQDRAQREAATQQGGSSNSDWFWQGLSAAFTAYTGGENPLDSQKVDDFQQQMRNLEAQGAAEEQAREQAERQAYWEKEYERQTRMPRRGEVY